MDSSKAISDLSFVRTELDAGVATVTMNRPERLNALGHDLRSQLNTVFRALDGDDAIRCIILTGSGRAFSSGADFADVSDELGASDILTWYRFGEGAYGEEGRLDIRSLHKPVVAAVNGLCYGAGLILTATCDLIVSNESARFCMIESRMGNGGSSSLPYLIGPQWTKYLMFSGEVITPQKAKEIGLVLEVIPDEQFVDRVHDLAHRIAAMPRYQVLMSKRQTDGTLDMMGYKANETFSQPNQAILNSLSALAETLDGRMLFDILKEEGFAAFKAARDDAHKDPWVQ